MVMRPQPLNLDLKGLRCVVIGAGRVAERRVTMLRRAGGRVRIVAGSATPRLVSLARRGAIDWTRSRFRAAHLRGAWLVIAATSDAGVNRIVAREARRRRIFVNVVDQPDLGTCTVPAVHERGALVVAVSTSGTSPALARALKDRIGRRFGPEYAGYLRLLGTVRRRLRRRVADPDERERLLARLLRTPLLPLIRAGRARDARRAAGRAVGLD